MLQLIHTLFSMESFVFASHSIIHISTANAAIKMIHFHNFEYYDV